MHIPCVCILTKIELETQILKESKETKDQEEAETAGKSLKESGTMTMEKRKKLAEYLTTW